MRSKTSQLPELTEEAPVIKTKSVTKPTLKVSGTLKSPMRSDDVKVLQSRLLELGYLKNESDVDGIFLSITETAVEQFQKENELKVDGIAGAFTLEKLGIEVVQVNPQQPVDEKVNPFKLTDGTPEFYLAAYKWLTYDAGFETRISNVAKAVIKNREIYENVAKGLGAVIDINAYKPGEYVEPWLLIGALHNMEASLSFAGVLHNGEKIIGTGRKTSLVPKGRGPFKTWAEAAVDALMLKGFNSIKDWSIGNVFKFAERYNGTGYLTGSGKAEYSPYLWAQTSINDNLGKYVADGHFSPSANANGQTGVAAIVKEVHRILQPSTEKQVEAIDKPKELVGLTGLILKENPSIEPKMINRAVPFLDNPTVKNKDYFVAINYSLNETLKRLYVINIKTGKVVLNAKVAIGKNSDKDKDGNADSFSNAPGSYQSSLGAILSGAKFKNPKWVYSWLLYGLEPKLNGNIQKREILLHSTTYVNDVEGKAIGETLGCIGVSEATAKELVQYIDGTLIYSWAEEREKISV